MFPMNIIFQATRKSWSESPRGQILNDLACPIHLRPQIPQWNQTAVAADVPPLGKGLSVGPPPKPNNRLTGLVSGVRYSLPPGSHELLHHCFHCQRRPVDIERHPGEPCGGPFFDGNRQQHHLRCCPFPPVTHRPCTSTDLGSRQPR